MTVDQQPIEVINELLNSCSGRMAEIGGVYKVLVGAPGMPVASFTDEDIIITEGQSYEPFPGLESTFNGVNATYPEPAEKWGLKDAPALRDTDLEEEDDDRRLPATVTFPYVYSGTQVQRLMQAMHLESRRFRSHSFNAAPEWWEYEVLDAVEWNSVRNGYDDKLFLITVMDDLPTGNQFVGMKEQDATDYDWDPDEDEQPFSTAPLVIARPAPQQITGFAVEPYTGVDADGNPRRPGFRIYGYGSGLDDVSEVWVQARIPSTTNLIIDGRAPYDIEEASPSASWAGDPLLPNEQYEVRGKLVPFSGRETEWSEWLTVTTPNVLLGANDISLELDEIAAEIAQQIQWIGGSVRAVLDRFREMGSILEAADLENYNMREQLSREINVRLGDVEAGFVEVIEVALGPGGAIATALSSLYAAMGGNTSEVNVRWEAVAAPSGYSARYAIQAAVNDGEFRAATFFMDVPADPEEPTRIVMVGDQVVIANPDGSVLKTALLVEDGEIKFEGARAGRISSSDGTSMYTDYDNPEIYMEGTLP